MISFKAVTEGSLITRPIRSAVFLAWVWNLDALAMHSVRLYFIEAFACVM